jgi:hypothetical protein
MARGVGQGQGYVKAIEPLQGQVMFDEVAQQHFAFEDGGVAKGRKLAYTQQRNRREYELHIKPSFGSLSFAAIDDGRHRAVVRAAGQLWRGTQERAQSARRAVHDHEVWAEATQATPR